MLEYRPSFPCWISPLNACVTFYALLAGKLQLLSVGSYASAMQLSSIHAARFSYGAPKGEIWEFQCPEVVLLVMGLGRKRQTKDLYSRVMTKHCFINPHALRENMDFSRRLNLNVCPRRHGAGARGLPPRSMTALASGPLHSGVSPTPGVCGA